MANGDGFFDGVAQVNIPILLTPGESLAAEWIPTAIESDFIPIINAGRAGVGEHEGVGKLQFIDIAVHQAKEAGHVVTVEQVKLRVCEFFRVNL